LPGKDRKLQLILLGGLERDSEIREEWLVPARKVLLGWICVRCERDAPASLPVKSGWLTVISDEDEMVALVCPECLTQAERDDWQAFVRSRRLRRLFGALERRLR